MHPSSEQETLFVIFNGKKAFVLTLQVNKLLEESDMIFSRNLSKTYLMLIILKTNNIFCESLML
jgi:hypothetical protein